MDNPQIAHHIEQLKAAGYFTRGYAAVALGNIGDATAVPALVEALKDEESYVRRSAAVALGNIRDATAVPALVETLKDEDGEVRRSAAEALERIGNSVTLPRKVLASSQFSAQNRIDVLEALRRIKYKNQHVTIQYIFPATRTLCQTVLDEEDAKARLGAQTVLNWLDGERELLISSMPATPTNNDNLVIAFQGGTSDTHPETLLISSDKPEEDIASRPPQPSLWQRLIGKQK